MKQNNITPFKTNIAKWYSDLVLQSDLISYAPVKGTMFFKPYGFSLWKNIENILTSEFNKKEINEVRFPLLLPESLLQQESKNFEGFSPEALTVTKVGNKKLNENYLIRPTSEALFGVFFKENLNSYKELPMKLNQWVNVMRWENNTRPFLRNSEFFWQEGHTTHTTAKDAKSFAKEMHNLYIDFAKKTLLLPVFAGEKTVSERFAGASNSYTIETILKDGQALQSGTSHYLSDKFTKAFDVKVQDENNKMYNPFQTSWGVSTRLIGAIIMTHSDDKGLVLPSNISPYKVVVMSIFADKEPKVLEVAKDITEKLSNLNVKLDDSNKGIGFKSQEWEVKGVPIRVEVGPRDLEEKNVTIVVRNQDKKQTVNISDITEEFINDLINQYDKDLFSKATSLREHLQVEISSVDEILTVVESGKYAVAYWKDDQELEAKIKADTGATIRVLLDSSPGKAINGGEDTTVKAIIARAY